jgi:hypothetical protein
MHAPAPTHSIARLSLTFLCAGALAVCACQADDSVQRLPTAPLKVSAETAIAPATTQVDAFGEQMLPTSFTGGGVRLVVHTDDIDDLLFAQRFSSTDGKPLDPTRILISRTLKDQPIGSGSSVAYDGQNFFIVWVSANSRVVGARLKSDGTLLDQTAIQIAPGPVYSWNPRVAFDGTDYLVVWGDGRNSQAEGMGSIAVDIYGARVRASDGAVLGSFPICNAAGVQTDPSVAFDGTNYAVVWKDSRQKLIHGARVRASDGAVLDSGGVLLTSGTTAEQLGADIAFDGSHYVLVWKENISIRYGRLSTALQPLDGAGVLLQADHLVSVPRLAYNNSHALAAWYQRQTGAEHFNDPLALATSLFETSDPLAPPGAPATIPTSFPDAYFIQGYHPEVSADGSGLLVTFIDVRDHLEDYDHSPLSTVRTARVDPATGSIAAPTAAALSAPKQEWLSASFDGRRHLVAWQETRDGRSFEVRAAQVDDGTGAAGASFALSSQPGNQLFPQTAYAAGQHLVVWWDMSMDRFRAVRVRASDGAVLDQPPLLLPITPGAPPGSGWDTDHPRFAVASDGHDFVVVWPTDNKAYALRLRGSDAAPLDQAPILVATGGAVRLRWPAVVFTAGRYLMTWTEYAGTADFIHAQRIVAARLSTAGAVEDPDGFTAAPVVMYDYVRSVALTATPDTALLVWGGGTGYSVWARRIRGSDGAVLDTTSLHPGPTYGGGRITERLAASFDGSRFLIVWPVNQSYDYNLHGIYLTPAGIADGAEFTVSATAGLEDLQPALSVAGPDRVLALYDRMSTAAGDGAHRAYGRWLGDGPAPDAGVLSPDAAPLPPDAAPVSPDAAPVSLDAAPVSPDAAPVPPDAAPDQLPVPADAALVVPADAAPLAADALAADGALAPDAGVPSDGGGLEDAGALDANMAPDLHQPDAAVAADGSAPADTSAADAPSYALDGPTGDAADRRDAALDRASDGARGGGGGSGWQCQMGVTGAPGAASLWWMAPAIVLGLRRRRRP